MKYKIMAIVLLAVFLYGCQQGTVDDTTPDVTPAGNGVVRVLPGSVNAGEEFKVQLNINLEATQTYYLFEEIVPPEFEILDKENKDNSIREAVIQGAESNVYEYTVKAPSTPGEYTFGGEYAVEGMKEPVPTLGENKVTVA